MTDDIHRPLYRRLPRQRFAMTYIVNREDRFYVVDYDGIDPITSKERRRWHPAGTSRVDADAIAARLDAERERRHVEPAPRGVTLARFLAEDWLPRKRRTGAATTAYRYAWMVEHYVVPARRQPQTAGRRQRRRSCDVASSSVASSSALAILDRRAAAGVPQARSRPPPLPGTPSGGDDRLASR